MSTYASIAGIVTLDPQAAAVFRTRPSWQWCEPGAQDDDYDDVIVDKAADGSLRLDFQQACYRNWCRYITEDLYAAQQTGFVRGTVTIECSDGGNWRNVTHFDGQECATGTESCFHAPVLLARATLQTITPATELLEPLVFLTSSGDPAGVDEGAPVMGLCGCGGWDDDTELPICANRPS